MANKNIKSKDREKDIQLKEEEHTQNLRHKEEERQQSGLHSQMDEEAQAKLKEKELQAAEEQEQAQIQSEMLDGQDYAARGEQDLFGSVSPIGMGGAMQMQAAPQAQEQTEDASGQPKGDERKGANQMESEKTANTFTEWMRSARKSMDKEKLMQAAKKLDRKATAAGLVGGGALLAGAHALGRGKGKRSEKEKKASFRDIMIASMSSQLKNMSK